MWWSGLQTSGEFTVTSAIADRGERFPSFFYRFSFFDFFLSLGLLWNRSPSTIARTGPFCCSHAWKPLSPTLRIWIGCARIKQQLLTAVPSMKQFVRRRFTFGWSEPVRLIHILTLVYLSHLPMNHPTFPPVHTQPNSTYVKTMRRWCKWSTKDEAKTKGTSQERTVSFFWSGLLERVNWYDSLLIKYVRTDDEWAEILTKGMCATMQQHACIVTCSVNLTTLIEWCPQLLSQTLLLHSIRSAPDDGSNDCKSRMHW